MQYLLLLLLPAFFSEGKTNSVLSNSKPTETKNLFQAPAGKERISAVVFKNQQFCRAELEDFEFETRFDIVSADVYFTGTNFKNTEQRSINSSSLKPLRDLMLQCSPGTNVVFDNIKVKGPDNTVRVIAGVSYLLY